MSQTVSPAAPGPGVSMLGALGAGAPPSGQAPGYGQAAILPPLPPTHDANTEILDGESRGGPDMGQAENLKRWIESVNIADELPEEEVATYGMRVSQDFEIDHTSCADWLEKYRRWMDRALQVTEPKTYPWVNASNVIFPLMSTASVQFAARAYPAIVVNKDVVKGVVEGSEDNDGLRERAERIGSYMSWQCLEEMPEWEGETDKLLHILPIVGSAFRKSYFDPALRRNVSRLVTSDKVIVNYKAISFYRAPRVTEIIEYYPHEIEEKVRAGVFTDYPYATMSGRMDGDLDAPIEFLEQHRRLDLDGDGYAEPYIVTVLKDTSTVARIVANYDMDGVIFAKSADGTPDRIRSIDHVAYYTPYEFLPNPDGGVYGIGFGHLLYPINAAIDTSLNQLLDAGHLANTGGGFIGKGVSLSSGSMRFAPGEYKQVNSSGPALKDNIVPLPFAGPNQVLFALLQFLVEAGKDVASIKDILMGQQPQANVAATTVLALIEQGMQVFSAIYKRVHRSLHAEYQKLYRLNRLYMDAEAKFRKGDMWGKVKREDFTPDSGCEPVSDPTMISNMQKLAKANFLLQFKDDPQINQLALRKRVFSYAGVDKMDELLNEQPPQPDPQIVLGQAQLALQKQIASEQLETKQVADAEEARRKRERDAVMNVLTLSQAYNQLAQAEKAAGDNDREWLTHQLEFMRSEIDRWGAGQTSAGGGTSDGGSAGNPPSAPAAGGNGPNPIQPMAQPPGNGAVSPLPAS
jgi:chaperonin GroES